jgi:hypothetical protein
VKKLSIVACVFVGTIFCSTNNALANDGAPVVAFGDEGRISIAPPNVGDEIWGEHVITDSEGRIISVTNVRPPMCPSGDITVRRHLADGSLDATFMVTTHAAPNNLAYSVMDLDIDESGAILLTGFMASCSGQSTPVGFVMKLTTTGVLDPAFDGPGTDCAGLGNGNGLATFDFVDAFAPTSLHTRADGRYVVNGGRDNGDLTLLTIDQDTGSCAMGDTDEYLVNISPSGSLAYVPHDLLPRPDGGYLSLGEHYDVASGDSQGFIVATAVDGSIDPSWGNGGTLIDTSSPDPGGYIDAVPLDDGGFVTIHSDESAGDQAVLRRFSAEGTLVPDFGTTGELRIAPDSGSLFPNSIVRIGDRLYVAAFQHGSGSPTFLIWSFDLLGDFDPRWGNNGTLQFDPSSTHADDYFFRLSGTPGGQLLAIGSNDTTGDAFIRQFVAAPTTQTVTPVRILDTRNAVGAPATKVTNTALSLRVAGVEGVPSAGVEAVTLNVTVDSTVAPDVGGYVTVYPCDAQIPDASNLNFRTGQIVANAVVAPLSADGRVCFYVYGSAHLIVDLGGWSATGSGFTALSPARIMSTRNGVNAPQRRVIDDTVTLNVLGQGGVPVSGVAAVSLNVTAVNTTTGVHPGYVTVYPCDAPERPDVSSLNFTANAIVPNAVIATVPTNGEVCFHVYGGADILVDVNGWFAQGSGYTTLAPARILNTREGVGAARQRVSDSSIELDVRYVETLGLGAIALNVTVTNTTAPVTGGFITVYPCDSPRPDASNLNFRTGHTIANAVTVRVPLTGPDEGRICFHVHGAADVIADVTGFYLP